MVQRRKKPEGSAEEAGPVDAEDRKWRGTPLRDLPDEEIETAIDYCLGMLNALWVVRQRRKNGQ